MLYLREIIEYELEIKNNILKILNLLILDENKYKFLKYFSKCHNIEDIL